MFQRLANPLDQKSEFPELDDLLKCGEIVNAWVLKLDFPAYTHNAFQGI